MLFEGRSVSSDPFNLTAVNDDSCKQEGLQQGFVVFVGVSEVWTGCILQALS